MSPKLPALLLFTALLSFSSIAQTYKIDTGQVNYENKLRPCFIVKYDADAKTVKKEWSNFLQKNYKVKTKGIGLFADKEIVSAEDVVMNSVSDKRMNIYINAVDVSGGSELRYFSSFGYDFFIGADNYPAEFTAMKKLLNDFSIEFLNEYYDDETSSIIKQIKGYEKDIRGNNKDINSNAKKAKKASSAVASGLDAKNNALKNDTTRKEEKIKDLQASLEAIKVKQTGIIRN